LTEALEVLTVDKPLVLVLEDLHWSDVSTLDWLAYVARRRATARLLILGTYRPVDAIVRQHPVRAVTQELQVHGHCMELNLPYLSDSGVAAYVYQRFGESAELLALASVLNQRAGGNPLFLVNMLDALVRQGMLREAQHGWVLAEDPHGIHVQMPESLRRLVEQYVDQLETPEQTLLEIASVMGREFVTAAVAMSMGETIETVETICTALARRGQFIESYGVTEWPNETIVARYRFIHDLYREVVYQRIPASQQARWHRQLGLCLENGYRTQVHTMAAELADHFMRGREFSKAVQYLSLAGENALRRYAYQEAIAHLQRGLALLTSLPATLTRLQQELIFQTTLGPVFITVKGEASSEVEQTYTRARELCRELGGTPQRFPVLMGLLRCYVTRGNHGPAQQLAEEFLHQAQHSQDSALLVEAHLARGIAAFCFGDLLLAREHLEQSLAFYDPCQHRDHWTHYARDPNVVGHGLLAWTLWALGYADQAEALMRQALNLAEELTHPASLAFTRNLAAGLCQRRREVQETQAYAESTLALASDLGLSP
ncbi:MAG: hypothetical protein ETSY2_47905, partial [Candidatus Entotheonella gemina]